jgi:hypothetical protein
MNTLNTITRRTCLAVPVTLPLLPVSAFATPANATDAAWAAYQSARAAFDATDRDYTAVVSLLPEHLQISAHPDMPWEGRTDEWQRKVDAFDRGRAEFGTEALGEACEQAAGLVTDAENVVLETPGTTLIDVERKLAIISSWDGENVIPAEFVDGVLADVRSINAKGGAA